MLYKVEPGAWLDAQLEQFHPDYPLLMRCWTSWAEPELPRNYMANDREHPSIIIGGAVDELVVLGDDVAFGGALDDLLAGNTVPRVVWPDEATRQWWARTHNGRPRIKLGTHGTAMCDVARSRGLIYRGEQDDGQGAYFYRHSGGLDCSAEIRHPCRVTHGLELYDLMRQSTDYDPSGEYTRRCLENGPSFVCEVDGEPVCWSCTHVCGALGMIYTPPRHRRKGYARSLAAFQVDYVLSKGKTAWCAILGSNLASQHTVESLGIGRMNGLMYWHNFEFPDGTVAALQAGG